MVLLALMFENIKCSMPTSTDKTARISQGFPTPEYLFLSLSLFSS